jgi:hypothetical protein
MKEKTIQHLNPVWGGEADYIIGIDVSKLFDDDDYDIVWEQLWSKKISDNHFMICCIPFFAYDLSLGDEVITDNNLMIREVAKPSGRYTYRVWFGSAEQPGIRKSLMKELEQRDCLLEWHSNDLLGVSCLEKDAQIIADLLFEKEKNGVIEYETGKTG